MRYLIFLASLIIFTIPLQAQEATVQAHYDCDNVNSPLKSATPVLTQIKSYTDTIFPRGSMLLDVAYEHLYGSPAVIADLIAGDTNTTFIETSSYPSLLTSTQFTVRYQQFYKGIKVEGGGYTASFKTNSDPGDPSGPCDMAFSISPFIITDIDLDVNPAISETDIDSIILLFEQETNAQELDIYKSELVVGHNIMDSCNIQLAYIVSYFLNGNKEVYVDAQSGAVIRSFSGLDDLNAPTQIYGVQNLNDRQWGQGHELITPDGQIKTYNWLGLDIFQASKSHYNRNRLPVTFQTEWTNEAPQAVWQAHYCSDLIMSHFAALLAALDINLGILHVAAGASGQNAVNFRSFNTETETYVAFGELGNTRSFATFDVMGHEIGHSIIAKFVNSRRPTGGSLHEALADLLGVYGEYKQKGVINWEMGDEMAFVVRDLANPDPDLDCFDEVEDLTSKHNRSVPLGHLFYLISEGDSGLGIPGIGIENMLDIVFDALQLVGEHADYADLREAMIQVIQSNFDICSDEATSVYRAWCEICVGTPLFCNYGCDFSLSGSAIICEEDDALQVCLTGSYNPLISTRWTIVARDGLNWVATGNQAGNVVTGGTCLTITDFPKYPYYPQFAVIKFYSPTLGPEYIQRKKVTLVDCNNDDLTCEEYYGIGSLIGELPVTPTTDELHSITSIQEDESVAKSYRIYNISGILVDSGTMPFDTTILENAHYKGIHIICIFSSEGKLLKSTKFIR